MFVFLRRRVLPYPTRTDTLFPNTPLFRSTQSDNPRVVLLTPGPYNEAYFEHIYLARELGATLVEGADIAMRDGRVYLKTLAGLEQVDVVLRRMDGEWCDPLEQIGRAHV